MKLLFGFKLPALAKSRRCTTGRSARIHQGSGRARKRSRKARHGSTPKFRSCVLRSPKRVVRAKGGCVMNSYCGHALAPRPSTTFCPNVRHPVAPQGPAPGTGPPGAPPPPPAPPAGAYPPAGPPPGYGAPPAQSPATAALRRPTAGLRYACGAAWLRRSARFRRCASPATAGPPPAPAGGGGGAAKILGGCGVAGCIGMCWRSSPPSV